MINTQLPSRFGEENISLHTGRKANSAEKRQNFKFANYSAHSTRTAMTNNAEMKQGKYYCNVFRETKDLRA